MGGLLGKNKRLCVFPLKVTFRKTKGKKASETAGMSCDASTWTGESHFYSARIGRTPRAPEPSLAESDSLDTSEGEFAAQAKKDTGAASLQVQHAEAPLPASTRDADNGEVPQDPETKPTTEEMKNQELAEQPKQAAQSARSHLEEMSKAQAVEQPAAGCIPQEQLSCGDDETRPLTQTAVKVEVHVCAEAQGEVRPPGVESRPSVPAEEDATVLCDSEETCEGKDHQEVPVENAAGSPPALSAMQESEVLLETMETREDITSVQRSAEKQAGEEKVQSAAKASPDLQLEHDNEGVPLHEYVEENAFESEQAEEPTEVGDDGQTSNEIPCCLAETQAALQDNEEIKASNGGKQPADEEC
ncbi:ubiquitin carboxyl-terminal hydrolase 42-like [Numida meleagris]|uniref:ubiquitin carboxyl-terminal hydrolase 42-like n=1 Tax=Numida meleagris TaxID=8996 RepID=UPI000B3E2089|nr:ubiquitin carboxyl-terminal hydrolase 42-like [Numida meleagris]